MINRIYIKYEDNQLKKKISDKKIKNWINKIFKELKLKNCSISIYFTDNENIEKLNNYYLNKNYPTDVLSFTQIENMTVKNIGKFKDTFLGDIVISVQYAEKSSNERKHDLLMEIYFLLLHGLLHIIGYDHENNNDNFMLEFQEKIFYKLTGVKIVL